MDVADAEPEWLRRFGAGAAAEEVVDAWLSALDPEATAEAKSDPPAARTALRRAIVDSRDRSSAVRADASAGWKYTGAIIRAVDIALGIGPAKASGLFGPKGVDLHAPKQVVAGDGATGTLGLHWSGIHGANRVDLLLANEITHRLNVAAECEKAIPESDALVTATVAMKDLQHEEMNEEDGAEWASIWVQQLQECIELLRGWRADAAKTGATVNVNVNCQMGKNRSGAVIAAWLCLEHGWKLLPVVDHLRSVSTLALGNPHLNVSLAHVVGADEETVPLNPADDGGSWVTFSPPGSPKAPRSPAEPVDATPSDDVAAEAARRLKALEVQGETEEAAAEEEDGLADLADLLDEM